MGVVWTAPVVEAAVAQGEVTACVMSASAEAFNPNWPNVTGGEALWLSLLSAGSITVVEICPESTGSEVPFLFRGDVGKRGAWKPWGSTR